MVQVAFDKEKRPKLGIGVLILNEFDEVLVSQRILPGTAFHDNWQFPGGYQEYGESFERTAQRELEEECGVSIPIEQFKFITVMNVLFTDHDYHNVGINMFVSVAKDQYEWKLMEPEKNTDWKWVKWDQFLSLEPKFIPFKYFFDQGFDSLERVKAKVGLLQ